MNKDFWKSPCYQAYKRTVNFKDLYFSISLNSDMKFVFFDKNWVGKMPHMWYFGQTNQNIPNQTSLCDNKPWPFLVSKAA